MTAVTTMLEEVLAVLAGALAPAPAALGGRVVDPVGLPVPGAAVRVVLPGPLMAEPLAQAITGADGTFFLVPAAALPAAYELVVEAEGVTRRMAETRPVPLALGDVRILLPLRLSASVGDGGENRANDVRRVQDRLLRLGRLTDADLAEARESVALNGPPIAPGPRTMAALAEHLASRFGRRLPVTRIEAQGPTFASLAEDGPFPLVRMGLRGPVGVLPGATGVVARNLAADVTAVQQRLNQLGFLSPAHMDAERASVSPLTEANRPRTAAAIRAFDREVAAGSLRAIAHEGLNGWLLDDPWSWGRRPVRLRGSVGEGGRNRVADVERAQDRLVELGFLAAAARDTERAAFPLVVPEGRVADGMIPATIAAIRELRALRLGETAPAAGTIDPVDATLQRINHLPRVELVGTYPAHRLEPAAAWDTWRPADIRQLQDRLHLLGFLPEYEVEKVDPFGRATGTETLPGTRAALDAVARHAGPLALRGSVGAGAANRPADVRLLQDRLHALRFLSEASHGEERVAHDAAAVDVHRLVSTFAAITTLRQRIFGLPAPHGTDAWTALPVVHPGDETHRFLIDPLFFGRVPIVLAGSVGRHGWNFPADVRAVQERLREMRLMTDAEAGAEPLVNPEQAGRVPESDIPSTLAALGRLRASLPGGTAGAGPARVEALSPAARVLDDPLGALRVPLPIAASVGAGGQNAVADVRIVQRRLYDLGFLEEDAFRDEFAAVPAEGHARLADGQIERTIAAIAAWQGLMVGGERNRVVAPRSETLLTLEWPRIPRRVDLGITGSVGPTWTAGRPNLRADVRRVQDRLFELGMMGALEYFTHRVDGAAPGAVPDAEMTSTADAIRRLQRSWAGVPLATPDGAITRGGRAQRVMEDPSFSTPTVPNANGELSWAGPPPLVNDPDLMRCMLAIEQREGGGATGEIPAVVRNASWTPASWGRAQMTAATAVNELLQGTGEHYREFYGLTTGVLRGLETRARDSGTLYDDHTAGRVGENVTEEELRALIQAGPGTDAAPSLQSTGFGPAEVARMFRAGQLRQHVLVARELGRTSTELLDRNAVIQRDGGQNIQPHAAENFAALELAGSDLNSFLRPRAIFEENEQGFSTRLLFWAPEGQVLRNLLTDDSGFKMGRFYISQLWQDTATLALTAEQRVRITAYRHHHGAGHTVAGLVPQLGDPGSVLMRDGYAGDIVARWGRIPAPAP